MPTTFAVRHFRKPDLDRVLEIERASFGQHAYDRNLFAEYRRKCGDLFLVALEGENICGYSISCRRGETLSAELISVAVDRKARKKGAGSALLASTIRRLRRRGIRRLNLMVKVTNEPAMMFYRKYGFHRIRVVREYYEDGTDGVRMRRDL